MPSSRNILMLLDNPFKSDARVEKEAASLLKRGYQVTLWAETSADLPAEETRGGMKVRRRLEPLFKSPLRRHYRENVAAVATEIASTDIAAVHCHDYQMLPYGAAAKRARPGLKLVYDAHEYLPGWPLHQTSVGLLNRMKGYLTWKEALRREREGARLADAMIVVSEPVAALYEKTLGLARPPTVVSNFPNEIAAAELMNDRCFHREYGLSDDQLVVVHAGNIYQSDEEIDRMLEGLARFPGLVLVFLGDAPRYRALEARIAPSPRVFFGGFHSQAQNIKRMASADIGVCHIVTRWQSQRITMANRYMEYTYAGLAVMCNEYEGARYITERFPNTVYYRGLGKSSDFEAKLTEAVRNRNALQSQSRLARTHYSFEREAEKLAGLYEGLLH